MFGPLGPIQNKLSSFGNFFYKFYSIGVFFLFLGNDAIYTLKHIFISYTYHILDNVRVNKFILYTSSIGTPNIPSHDALKPSSSLAPFITFYTVAEICN